MATPATPIVTLTDDTPVEVTEAGGGLLSAYIGERPYGVEIIGERIQLQRTLMATEKLMTRTGRSNSTLT